MSKVVIAGVTINKLADLNSLSTADLLAFYNKRTGKNTKQFLKRAKGMQQVWALIEADVAQQDEVPSVVVGIPFVVVDSPNKTTHVETPSVPAAGGRPPLRKLAARHSRPR